MPQDEIIRKKPLAPKIEEIFWMRFRVHSGCIQISD